MPIKRTIWKKWTNSQKDTTAELNQKEIENMTRPITSDEIETVIKNLPTSKSPGPECFTGDLCQTFREELTSFLLKRFHKN